MKRTLLYLLLSCASLAFISCTRPAEVSLMSPDKTLEMRIVQGSPLTVSVYKSGEQLLAPSPIGMTLDDGTVYEGTGKAGRVSLTDRTVEAPIYKKSLIHERFRERTISFGTFDLVCRAYDNGAAWRFVSRSGKPFKVVSEKMEYNFPEDWTAWIPYNNASKRDSYLAQLDCSFENTYVHVPLSKWDPKRLAFFPLVVDAPGDRKICISEADLLHYPNMCLSRPEGAGGIQGFLAPYPAETVLADHGINKKSAQRVVRHSDYIAECAPGEKFPWRIVEVEDSDAGLLDSDLVYLLSTPSDGDFSWVVPGKSAWDWWAGYHLPGAGFEGGINTQSYCYDIDVAEKLGLEYILIDAGWYDRGSGDLFQVVPELDLQAVVDYGRSKGVGVILWAGSYPFEKDMEKVCSHYSKMGIRGFKVDYFDRGDQYAVDLVRRIAQMCAQYRLVVDYHGVPKPAGLHRTWPNVLNFEAVFGMEQLKWNKGCDMVTYDVTFPFARLVAGPADYTQGAMINATREQYKPVYEAPMSQGTRCRQVAEYVVFHSPLVMLCDAPSNYMTNLETARFIASIPTVWDETVPLDSKMGELVSIARRKGDEWFVGAICGWEGRELDLDLSFLGEGEYEAEIMRDGSDAGENASSYVHETRKIGADRSFRVRLAPGGGAALRIRKI